MESGSHQSKDYLVVLAGHNASTSLSWVPNWAPRPFVALYKQEIPNTGYDASTYLWWIIQNYHRLPKWTLFLHNHEYHWHHPLYSQLVSMVLDVDTINRGYLNVAHDRNGKPLMYHKGALLELNVSENEQAALLVRPP